MNKRINKQLTSKHKQSGFSLIEALVAFLILSIGMLGIASLQTMSLKSGHTAVLRTGAIMSVDDIIERMRANRGALASYAAATGYMGTDNVCAETTVAAAVCTPVQLADDDLFRWKNALKDVLPNNAATTASVVVTVPVPPSTTTNIVVTVNWSERNTETGTASPMNYTIALQM